MLYTPIKLRNLELKNRWVMSPMCMYSSENGVANDFHLLHYGSRAQGGTGLIIVEATGVIPEGRITNNCMGIWNDEQVNALSKIVKIVHENSDSKIGIQLAHAGRKASTWNGKQISLEEGWETVAPSPIPYEESERIPHELTVEEIKDLVSFSVSICSILFIAQDLLYFLGRHLKYNAERACVFIFDKKKPRGAGKER